jgi:hypothetical protein
MTKMSRSRSERLAKRARNRANLALFALGSALAAPNAGCLVLDNAQVAPEEPVPPSVVDSDVISDQLGGPISMSRVITIDLDSPMFTGPSAELRLPVIVRDANVLQDLEYILIVDSTEAQPLGRYLDSKRLSQSGTFEREIELVIPISALAPAPACRRIELFVSGEFSVTTPATPGDLDTGVWWIKVIDLASQNVDLSSCPQ